MKLTWFGHSAFRIEVEDLDILIDPFLTGNPKWPGGLEGVAERTTHVLLTHGHDDHIGDSVAIIRNTGAMLVANYELCLHLVSQGVEESRINPGNHGGTVDCNGFTTTFVNALHSSSSSGTYLGNPAGLVLHFPQAPTLYHMGDTDIFSDMALIAELHNPRIGLVPIGDRFTMGGAVAGLACRRFFNFESVVPCHYGTFDVLEPNADVFLEAMEETETKVLVPPIGSPLLL